MNAVLKPTAAGSHPHEWRHRVQLAACYRVFDALVRRVDRVDRGYQQ